MFTSLFSHLTVCIIEYITEFIFLKILVFWNITPCSKLTFNRPFGGTRSINLEGVSVRQTKKQHEAGSWLCYQKYVYSSAFMRKCAYNVGMILGKWILCEWIPHHYSFIASHSAVGQTPNNGTRWETLYKMLSFSVKCVNPVIRFSSWMASWHNLFLQLELHCIFRKPNRALTV
jgi:hypothetical protein